MINQRKTEIKVGIVSIVAIILFVIGMTLGRGCNVSVSQQYLNIRFPNSGGIQISNPVVVNGVQRGRVVSINNDNGSVLIEIMLDNIDDIYSDATAIIKILDITGGKKIEIHPGTSGIPLDPSKEMQGQTSADIADLFLLFGNMSEELISVVHRLDTLTERLSYIVNRDGFTDNVANIVKNTDELIANANELLKQNLNNINTIVDDIRSLVSTMNKDYKRYEPRLDTLIDNLNIAVNSANNMMMRIDTSITSANSILTDVNSITSDIKNGNGTISKLIYDENLAAKLDSTVNNLNALIEMIEKFGINVNVRLGTRP